MLQEFLFGTPSRIEQISRFTPNQQNALNQLLQVASQGLQGQSSFDFGPIAQQARDNFNQRTIPTLAERFSSMGAQGSSAFRQSLGQAGAQLESSLASMQSQMGMQNQNQRFQQLLALLQLGLQPQNEQLYTPASSGFLGGLGTTASQGLGALLPLVGLLGR